MGKNIISVSEFMEITVKKASALCTAKTLGTVLGISDRRVRQLTEEGVFKVARTKFKRMHYRLDDSVQSFVKQQVDVASKQSGDPAIERFRSARAKREEIDAAMATIELGHLRQKYLLASAVEEAGIRMLTACRARMLAIPATVSHSLIALTDSDKMSARDRFHQIYQVIQDKIYAALREIADLPKAGPRNAHLGASLWRCRRPQQAFSPSDTTSDTRAENSEQFRVIR